MTSNHAVVWIVKGTPAGNGQWGWSISKVTPLYNNFTPSPSAWENLFPNGKIPDGWYAQPSVRITNEGNYFIDAL
ncbi:MAG TPA: hypothetical protein VG621_03790 [Candidatus Paceibacterota bacterium]|nr:hypothetical protein [Candidatus Paceibacterota bacterium]